MAGNVGSEPDSISWNGLQSLNMSWQEIQDDMFLDFESLRYNYNFWRISKEKVRELNLLPFMKCLEVKNYPKLLSIGSKTALNVFLSDAKRQTYYRN